VITDEVVYTVLAVTAIVGWAVIEGLIWLVGKILS